MSSFKLSKVADWKPTDTTCAAACYWSAVCLHFYHIGC